jgi:hypothetical protein
MEAPDELAPTAGSPAKDQRRMCIAGRLSPSGALLVVLGRAMAAISRIDPATRRQITRDVVVEISTADGVARH